MDKKLRLSVKGTIGFLTVFAVLLWMWSFFRSYLLFMVMLLMIMAVIISGISLWLVRSRIRVEITLPKHRVGKNTDIPADIRVLHSLRFAGFPVDITYIRENLFTGSAEEKKEKLWAAPGQGGRLRFLLNSRYAGWLRVRVKEYRVYDLLHLFYLTCQEAEASEVLSWPAFLDEADAEAVYENIEGFPKEDESKRRGMEYDPDYEIREYIPGDALKSIHWKLSAKYEKMMVRERLAAGKEKVNVLLPLGEDPDANDALMESLYGICRLLLSREYPIQLFWQGMNQSLCSRYITETGELESVVGEILGVSGIRVSGSIEEQMAIEHPAEHFISCQQEIKQRCGAQLVSSDQITKKRWRHKRGKADTADLSLVKLSDNDKFDLGAAFAKALVMFLIVYGAVGGFLEAYEISFHSGFCMLMIFVPAFVLSAVYETGKRWLMNLMSLIALLLFIYIAVTNYWVINSGYYYILNRIFDQAREYFNVSGGVEYTLTVDDGYMAVTTFAIFLGMVGVILLNIRLQNKCTLFRVMLLTLTPYVIPMYFERSPSLLYSMFLLAGYAAVMMLSYGRGRVSKQMRCLWPVTAAVVLFVRAAVFLIPEAGYDRIVPQSGTKEMSENRMEQFARYGMLAFFPQDITRSGISAGKLSRGSAVMPSYETALIVRYTPYSFQPVYLKAFTGLDYIGTSWTEAEAGWPGDGNMESSLYGRQRRFEDGGAEQGCGVMEVEKTNAEDTFEYRPYYTDHRNIVSKGNTLVYRYYPDNGSSVLLAEEEPYERYLDVPDSCEAAVSRVCEEAGFGGTQQEIAQQVVTYFAENYNYTLRPGYDYGSPDYISHFLLESRKGYCAHFASAAVMLFRQMGIPARYVEGYAFSYAEVVENGELVEGADYSDYYSGFSELGETALIRLEIPEAYAHAWVEVFDRERGWLVVDPTPSSSEEETPSFWEAFLRSEGGGTALALGADTLGGYLENALGAAIYVFFAVFIIVVILFAAIRMIRKEKERRLPGRERVKLEYRRLQKAAAKRDKSFLQQRTLQEQIAWMREKCGAKINDEQEEALYQVYFGKNVDYDCDKLCRELRGSSEK